MNRQHNYNSINSLTNNSASLLDGVDLGSLFNYGSAQDKLTENINLGDINTLNANLGKGFIHSASNVGELGSKVNAQLELKPLSPDTLLNGNVDGLSSNPALTDTLTYTTFDANSGNQQLLPTDKNIRAIEYLNPLTQNKNISNPEGYIKSAQTIFPKSHIPTSAISTKLNTISFDKFSTSGANPGLLSSKEDVAPSFTFTPLWATILSNSDTTLRLSTLKSTEDLVATSSLPLIQEYVDYDFRN